MLTPGLMVMETCAVVVAPAESVTFTLKLVVPSAVGLPEMTPPEDKVIPAGREVVPDTDHVYPVPDPPLAANVVGV